MSQHNLSNLNGLNVNGVNNISLGGFDMNLLPALPISNVVSTVNFSNISMNPATYELSHFASNNSPDTATGDAGNGQTSGATTNAANASSGQNGDFSNARSHMTSITNENTNTSNNNNGTNAGAGNGAEGVHGAHAATQGMNGGAGNLVNHDQTGPGAGESSLFDAGMDGDDDDDDIDNNADIDDDIDNTGTAPPKKKRKINGSSLSLNGSSSLQHGKHKPVKEWRKSTHAQTSEKMKKAIKFLDEFRSEHNNKLPSLRAIMKMMKVGFPKAHEILNSYAAHVQIPKHVLMQDMVVRQERAKEDETSDRSKSRGRRGGGGTRREGKPATDSDEDSNCSSSEAVNQALKEMIVRILRLTNSMNKHEYYDECKKLEELVKQFEPNYNEYGVNDRLRLAQSYFLLGSMYRERNERNEAYSYVEKALSTFRDCNTQAQSFGYNVQLPDHITAQEANVSSDDIGHFWPQIFEVYILGGHVLLANSQYADAKTMYELARDLARYIDGPFKVTVSEALENLAVVSMYMNDVDASIEYTKQIIDVLSKQNVRQIKIFNAKAYYACCLTLSPDSRNEQEGLKVYKEVINGAEQMFGSEDPSTLGFYCYFGLHWVQIKDFNKAQEHIEKVINVSRPLKGFERKVLHDLLNDFIEAVIANNDLGRLQNLFQWQIENASKFNQDPDTAPDKRIDIYQLHLTQARSYAKVHEFSKALSIYNHVLRSYEGTNSQRKNELAAEIQQVQAQQQMMSGVNVPGGQRPSPPVVTGLGNMSMPMFNGFPGVSGVPGVPNLPPMPQPLATGANGGNPNQMNIGMNGVNGVNGMNLGSGPGSTTGGNGTANASNAGAGEANDEGKNTGEHANDLSALNGVLAHQMHSHSTSSSSTSGTRTTAGDGTHGMPPPPPPVGSFNYPFQSAN